MTLYFSPSTCGFYDSAINAAIPADKVEITEAERTAALAALAPGKAIMAGQDGKPIAALRPITADEAMRMLRRRRDMLIRASDKTQLADFPLTETERQSWAAYRTILRDLPDNFASDPAAAVWPEPPTPGVVS